MFERKGEVVNHQYFSDLTFIRVKGPFNNGSY